MRNTYYISVPAGPDQEVQIESALKTIDKLKATNERHVLKRFDVVSSQSAKSLSDIYKVSGRIYFYGTQNDKNALKDAGFDVHLSPARYPEPSTPELHQ